MYCSITFGFAISIGCSEFLITSQITYLQKLIAYDHLEGDPGLDGGKNAPLFTDILNMVCGCVDNSSPDRYLSLMLVIFSSFYVF